MSAAATSGGAAGIEYETAVEGQPLKLAAEVGGGDAPFTYQWYKDGAPVAGATQPRFELAAGRHSDAGLYAVVVANAGGSAASLPIILTVTAARPSRLANASIMTAAEEPVIVGFTVGGGAEGQSNRFLIRAAGPALAQFGVSGILPDPVLELGVAGGGVLTSNDNWGNSSNLAATAASVGAFAFPSDSRDAAVVADLPPGGYNVRVQDALGLAGTTAVELYEARIGATPPVSRLVNLSARSVVGSNAATFTLGFTIEGHDPVRLLVRGVGPELTRLGVANALADPRLLLFRAGQRVSENDDWGESRASDISAAAAAVGAFALSAGSRDAALLVVLEPGSYTVQLVGKADAVGPALIELYAVP
ncbi:MAG: immunoglobulin domain-containing protein [Opitutaceae bacterium]|nr:immunoglobulin domain-containing protein [Opitutaceae bacterium]